jgi:SAM-dependent methyltransferase
VEGVSALAGYDVVTCQSCGFAYADGIPSQEVFDRYYRDASKYEYHQRDGQESPFDTARMEVIADVVAPLIPGADASIIDIGCATGRLLYLLRERGFAKVTGLDPSPGCAVAAQRLYNIRVVQGNFGAFPNFEAPFDVAILVGVLEHVRDLDTAMQQVASAVAEGGIVYVEVPDVLEFWRWPNAPFQDFSIEHINFFSPRSVANLFARYGFAAVFVEQNSRQQAYRTVMSNVSAAFRKQSGQSIEIVDDRESRPALMRYIEQCRSEEELVRAQIAQLADSGRSVVIWGVGTNATRLLTTTRLAEVDIAYFVDSNSKYHGKTLAGHNVKSPEELRNGRDPILILSRVFQQEISEQIRALAGPDREILTLYRLD